MNDRLHRIETYCRRIAPASVVARQILERYFDANMMCQAYRCEGDGHTIVHRKDKKFTVCQDCYGKVFDGKAITLWDGEFWRGFAPGEVHICE